MLPANGNQWGHQVLVAAERAWVFGGMLSWNDPEPWVPQLESAHKAASDELWDAELDVLVAATNSYVRFAGVDETDG
jgi:hypothetical protein